jgi:hypothetical protein
MELLVSRNILQTLMHSIQSFLQNFDVSLVDNFDERIFVIAKVETDFSFITLHGNDGDINFSLFVIIIELKIVACIIENDSVTKPYNTCDIVLFTA